MSSDALLRWGSGSGDLTSFSLHEFGHAIGIGHPSETSIAEPAVMSRGNPGGQTRRNLYQYDISCARDVIVDGGQERSTFLSQYDQTAGNIVQNPVLYANMVKASPYLFQFGVFAEWSIAHEDADRMARPQAR